MNICGKDVRVVHSFKMDTERVYTIRVPSSHLPASIVRATRCRSNSLLLAFVSLYVYRECGVSFVLWYDSPEFVEEVGD